MSYSRYLAASSFVPALFLLGLPGETHFYIDPGTGSLVLQAVVGGLVGTLVAVKIFWSQIKGFFGRLFHVGKKRTEHEEHED